MEGGLARTDPPSPRALPTLARQGIWGGSFSDSQAWTGLETSTLTRGGREAQRLGGPTSSPLAHVPINTLVVSTVPLQGQPSLGSGRGGPCTPRAPFFHHLSSSHQLPWQPPGPPPSQGGNDLPVHGLSPQRAPAQHGGSEKSGPRRGRTLCSQRGLLWLPRERRLRFKKWWD